MTSWQQDLALLSTLGLGTFFTVFVLLFTVRAVKYMDRSYFRPLVIAHIELIHEMKRFVQTTEAALDTISQQTTMIHQAVIRPGRRHTTRPKRPRSDETPSKPKKTTSRKKRQS